MTDEAPARRPGPRPTPPPDGVDILRLEEAGYLMGRVSARTVRRLIAEGKLRALTVSPTGTSLRVRREEVERYLRGAEFVERPGTPDEPKGKAEKEDGAGFRVKADWVTDVDPFAPRRKTRKPSSN